MDAPAPDNIAAEEGGQDEKEHRPMFRRVKDKMKKIKNTIAGHGHEQDTGEDEEDAAMREAEVEKQVVEDKPISSPELHGAPVYDSESERIPAAAKEVKHKDAPGVRLGDLGAPAAAQEVKRDFDDSGGPASAKEVKRDDAPGVRLGELGAPAAPQEVKRDDAPGVRLGELGAPAAPQEVKRDFGDSGGPASAKEVKRDDATGVRLGELGAPAAPQEVKRDDAAGLRLGELCAPAAPQEVKREDAAGMQLSDSGGPVSAKEVKCDDAPGVRLGDLGAPAAPQEEKRDFGDSGGPESAKELKRDDAPGVKRDDDPEVRLGDLGGPAAAQEVKRDDATATGMRLSDFGVPASAKEVKHDDAQGVRLGDLGSPVVEDPAASNARTPMPRGGEDMGTTDAVRNLEAMTVSDDDPKQVGARKMDVPMPVSDGTGEEWNDAPTDAEKVAGVGTVVASKAQQVTPGFGAGAPESVTAGAGKRDLDLPQEGTRASYTGTEELKNAATGAEGPKKAATDATGAEGLKNAETGAEELKKAATDATTEAAPAATYTDMIMSAAAGTAEYGKKLASTVYEKVAGVGTSEASKAQQVTTSAGTATPGVGAQDGATTTRATGGPGNGQDKGATGVTAYIAEKLRPGDEERSLSEAITGAVQQRKEGVGSTVAQAVTSARGAVTSLTGGNRVSETVQPSTEGNIGEGVAAEGQVLHGAAPSTNTNAM